MNRLGGLAEVTESGATTKGQYFTTVLDYLFYPLFSATFQALLNDVLSPILQNFLGDFLGARSAATADETRPRSLGENIQGGPHFKLYFFGTSLPQVGEHLRQAAWAS